MPAGSFDLAPVDVEAIHQAVDAVDGMVLCLVSQMRVADGSKNGVMAKDLLHLDQVDAGFDQVCGIGVSTMSLRT